MPPKIPGVAGSALLWQLRRNQAVRKAGMELKKNTEGGIKIMLIIDSKDCENIDKALKKYKKKVEKSKVLLQLRERQSFIKPSVRRRGAVLKAIYKQKIASGKIEG